MSDPKNSPRLTLGDVLREQSAQRPAATANGPIQWELVREGIRPLHREAVDCGGHNPGYGEICHNKPVWVIEDIDGYYPTCLTHSGQVLNEVLRPKYANDAEFALYFHAYKGE